MSQTPQEFIKKNMKWIALTFLCLFIFSSIRSCVNSMSIHIKDKEVAKIIDSLTKKINILEDDKKQLTFDLKLEKEKAGAAEQRASAIQSVAEKIKSNTTTTVNVRGAQMDTIKRK